MAVNTEKKSEQVLMNLAPTTFEKLSQIAEAEDRKLGYVARELMLRGLSLYEQDGNLRFSQAALDAAREGVKRAIPKNVGKLAPVVAHIGSGQPSKAEVRRMVNADEIKEMERRLKPRKTQKVATLKQKTR